MVKATIETKARKRCGLPAAQESSGSNTVRENEWQWPLMTMIQMMEQPSKGSVPNQSLAEGDAAICNFI